MKKLSLALLFAATVALAPMAAGVLAQEGNPKKDEPKKDEPKKDEPKKDEPKKDEPKKDDGSGGDPDPKDPKPHAPPEDDVDLGELDQVDPNSPNLKPPATTTGDKLKRYVEAASAFGKARADALKGNMSKPAFEAAIAKLKASADEDSKNPLPLYLLGIAHQWTGEIKKAFAPLKTAIELNPKFHEAMVELGDCYQKDGKGVDAGIQYGKVLQLKPDHVGAGIRQVQIKCNDAKFSEARDDIQKIAKAHPESKTAKFFKKNLDLVLDGPKWPDTEKSFKKESQHYIVYTNTDQEFCDKVSNECELIRKLYERIFSKVHPNQPIARKTPVIIWKDAKEYHANGGPKNAGGHYQPNFRVLFFFRYEKDLDTLLVLHHENFHQFLHPYLAQSAPDWFNEGLADYFGPARYSKTKTDEGMKIVPSPWRLSTIKALIGANRVKSLQELCCMTRPQFYDPKTIGQNYAQAWSLCYFLCEKKDPGKTELKWFRILAKYFMELRKGSDMETCWKESFGKEDVATIDREWRQFVLATEAAPDEAPAPPKKK